MLGTAVIELRQSRGELYHIMGEEALSLAEAIDRGATNAITSMDRLEDLLALRLLNNATFIARLDSLGVLRPSELAAVARDNALYRVNIFDRQGRKVMSSVTPEPGHEGLPSRYSPDSVLVPILSGSVDRMIIGTKEARTGAGQRFAVAVRRSARDGGAIVVNVDAEELLRFRRSMGIGTLIRALGDNSGVVYIALQDHEGIIAASATVRELSSIADDPLLQEAISADTALTRVLPVNGSDVFEVVRRFEPGGQEAAVLRIALAMDEVASAESRMTRRMVILSIVVVTLGAFAVTLLMSQQNYRVIQRKFEKMTTFTGNVLEQMRDGVATMDAGGVVSIFNARAGELLGYDVRGIEQQALDRIPEGASRALRAIFEHPDGTTEMLIDRPDGTQRVVAVTLSTTLDPAGGLESRTAVLRDLTEARRLERQAQRREKLTAMGELASGVAHEIRNPLNAIAMIAQRFEREFSPRSGAAEYRSLARVMQDETRRVNGIIRQFLSFARPARPQRRPTPIPEILDHLASLVSSQAATGGITLSASTDTIMTANLDPDQVTQALLNVVQNAIDATPRGGTVTITASTYGDAVRFTVRDTGKGIPPEGLDKVFNLYYTTKPEGTGLGLPLTQQIVGQHGGTVEIQSSVGQGTTVTVDFPLA